MTADEVAIVDDASMRCLSTRRLPWIFTLLYGAVFCQTGNTAEEPTPPSEPQAFWAWLIDTGTSFDSAQEAAYHSADHLPIQDFLPILLDAREQIRREWDEHAFGLAAPLLISVVADRHRGPVPRAGETIAILGREYRLPRERIPYPADDEGNGPWPFRVRRIVEIAFHRLAPKESETTRLEEWRQALLDLPVDEEEDALRFLAAARINLRLGTIDTLKKMRRIAMDPDLDRSAVIAADSLGALHQLFRDPDGRRATRVVAAQVIRSSPHREARARAAYGLRQLTSFLPAPEGTPPSPPPYDAILAACEQAVAEPDDDMARSNARELLFDFVHPVLDAWSATTLLDTPFDPDRTLEEASPEVPRRLAFFAEWFSDHAPALRRRAAEERALALSILGFDSDPED